MSTITNLSRRTFLKAGAAGGAGLLLGFTLPGRTRAAAPEAPTAFAPNAWLQIDPDDTVTIWIGEADMGQGVRTALPMLVADELEADWATIRIRQAEPDPKFGNLGTGGSSSIRSKWMPLRRAGAAARAMLVAAAAQTWEVPEDACEARDGAVHHAASGQALTYGQLAATAATLPVPEDPPLKDPEDFRFIGRPVTMLDTPDKVTGRATFGIDVRVPGMLFASVERCPEFGGSLAGYDAEAARAVPGVRQVIEIPPMAGPVHRAPGVAVVADSTWAALKGRRALGAEWTGGPHADESTEALRARFEELTSRPGHAVRTDGDADAALAEAAQTIESVYELPFLAHAPMEPMNCTVHARADGAEVWAPTQFPTWYGQTAAEVLGLQPEQVTVHTTLLGGGFGRRANPDVVAEAAFVAKHVDAPVQVVWTREDDIRHDFYRPANYHRLSAGLDAEGHVTAWRHRVSTPAIGAFLFGNEDNAEGETGGAWDLPYGIPNLRVEYAPAHSGVPRGWWRSVEHSYTGFVVNGFLDEVAAAAGRDPYELRLDLLDRTDPDALAATLAARHGDRGDYAFDLARYRNVLVTAAEKAGWGTPLPDGTGRGIAAHWSFLTYVAEVAEVTVGSGGQVVVNRVVCVVDCGQVVNPRTVEEQMEGAIIYGLTAALKGHLDVERGRVVQSNFHDYEMLRMNEAPAIEVHLVPSTKPPSGAGEPGLPPAAPAVAAAIYDATGKRVRRLPIALDGLS